MKYPEISSGIISEIIGMAWADDVSFDAIEKLHGLAEKDVITLMRSNLKPSSFRLWRKRVSGRKAKHETRMRPEQASPREFNEPLNSPETDF